MKMVWVYIVNYIILFILYKVKLQWPICVIMMTMRFAYMDHTRFDRFAQWQKVKRSHID